MPVKGGPNIRTSQAIVWLDAADKSSYPGTGTTWINSVTPGTYNGTLTNTSFNSTDALGALFFSGSNTFADMGNIGAISASYTFQVAVKPLPTGSPYTILSYTSGSGTGSVTFRLDYSSSIQTAVFSAFASSGSVNKTYSLSTTIPTGSWSILHGVFNGATLGLYKNGSFISSTLITGSNVGYSANNRFLVGGVSQFTGSYLSGSVGNVAVYNTNISFYSIATNYNGLATRFGLPTIVTPSADPDVQAFIEAAGIVDPTEISAVTILVTDLKTYNLWTKMKAIYPMVGSSATSQKYNLKNPNTFTGTFVGGWTHSSTGATPNGINTYFRPFLTPSIDLLNADFHLSYYSRTNIDANTIEMGCGDGSGLFSPHLRLRFGTNQARFICGNTTDYGFPTSVTNSDSRGLFVGTILSTSDRRFYKNSSLIQSNTSTISNSLYSGELLIGAYNSSTSGLSVGFVSTKECAFASIGNGLTDTDASNLYTAVQAFQTTLGRQV
jgi:hypothetical protein